MAPQSERHLLSLSGAFPLFSDFLPALMNLRRYVALIDFTDALHCLIGHLMPPGPRFYCPG